MVHQPGARIFRSAKSLVRELKLCPVVGAQKVVAVVHRLITLVAETGQSQNPSLGFRHLLGFHDEILAMEPIVDPFLARRALGLRDLVGVVDLNMIHPTAVYVELISQILHGHGTALDMPARVTPSPG